MKRRYDDEEPKSPHTTPKKSRTAALTDNDLTNGASPSRRNTPSRLRREYILDDDAEVTGVESTPKSARKVLFATPQKTAEIEADGTPTAGRGTPTLVRNADRSARRKSARRLIEREIDGGQSDEDVLEEEDILAAQILQEDGEDDDDEEEDADEDTQGPETPSKRRGRPRAAKKRKERSPTPPINLPSHELYFWQNRPGANKTSNNTLGGNALLNHEEYFHAMESLQEGHEAEREFLLELHARAFDQWLFELEEGFNLALYGYGSKRPLLDAFAEHLYNHLSTQPDFTPKNPPRILMINGSNPSLTTRDILTSIATTFLPNSATTKLPTLPPALISYIIHSYATLPPAVPSYVIISALDSPHLRRHPTPALLASLVSSIPSLHLIASFDTPNFPLLYDTSLLSAYHFLFHDATTFAPYTTELNVVDDVNQLLGRSGRRITGKDGVEWVLRSLSTNARELYQLLLTEQLAAMLEAGEDLTPPDPADAPGAEAAPTPFKASRRQTVTNKVGIEFRALYQKAASTFVATSELTYRSLLKEFFDHDMVESRKDGAGTEWLSVPFGQEDLEGLVEMLALEE